MPETKSKAVEAPKLKSAYPKNAPLPREVVGEIYKRSASGVNRVQTVSETKGLSGILSKASEPMPTGPAVGPRVTSSVKAVGSSNPTIGPLASSASNMVKAGIQAAIITQGFQEWDKMLMNPETALGAISDTKEFYASIKGLPKIEQAKEIGNVATNVAQEVGAHFKDASKEMIDQGVDMAKTLYDMTPEQRNQFLTEVKNGTIENLKGMADSAKAFYDLPMEDKVALFKNLGNRGLNKAKTWAHGAKRIFDAMTSR